MLPYEDGRVSVAKHLLSSRNREFRSLLDKCADTEHLTVFVGAGCSAEVGLPTWGELLDRYLGIAIELKLQDAAPDAEDYRERDAVIEELKSTFVETTRVAMIGDMLLGDKRKRSALRLALYRQIGELEPGPTAKAVAQLYKERLKRGHLTTLVTTNYDSLLELALVKAGLSKKVIHSRTLDDLSGDDDIVDALIRRDKKISKGKHVDVWHLHGYMPFEQEHITLEPIVFSERDYGLYNLGAVDSIASLFDIGSCLFTGMSLVDFDIATAAFSANEVAHMETGGKRKRDRLTDIDHFAVTLGREGHGSIASRLGSARLDSMGIHPLGGVSTYAQIPQVIHELALRVEMGDKYWTSDKRYGQRLVRWANEHEDAQQRRRKGTYFLTQVKLAEQLADELTRLQVKTGISSIGDSLGLHIWKREPDSHTMSMWISTEYARRQNQSPGSRGPIEIDSRFCAVRTAANGVPSRHFESLGPDSSSKWMQSLGVPIVTPPRSKFGRLLVGVITLSSDLDQRDSELAQMLVSDPSLIQYIEKQMRKIGKKLLVP